MKTIISLLSFTLIFIFGCKKEKVTYSLTGQLVSCGSTQYTANSYVDLFQQRNGGNYKSEIVATTTTDSDGKFSFTYTPNNNLDNVLILRQSSRFGFVNLVEGIPIKNIPDFKYYYSGSGYHLIVSLNVQKPYTANDTLYVYIPGSTAATEYKAAGPFVSGRIITKINQGFYPKVNYSGTEQTIRSGLLIGGNDVFNKTYTVPFPTKCEGDSIYVNLDIR